MSTDTEFFTKRPILKVFVDIILKRIELIITNALVSAGILLYAHHMNHNQIWHETGPHFQDLVKGEQALQATNSLQQKKETKQ